MTIEATDKFGEMANRPGQAVLMATTTARDEAVIKLCIVTGYDKDSGLVSLYTESGRVVNNHPTFGLVSFVNYWEEPFLEAKIQAIRSRAEFIGLL